MAKGESRDSGGWALVAYDNGFTMRMHRTDYEARDLKPAFDSLPMRRTAEGAKPAPAPRAPAKKSARRGPAA